MANTTKIQFCIDAGKYEGNEVNWKYIDQFDSADAALAAFKTATSYPVCDFYIRTEWDDGSVTRSPVFGGVTEKLVDGHWQAIL